MDNKFQFLSTIYKKSLNYKGLKILKDFNPCLICSFPRSGSGWIRLMYTACLLHKSGYKVQALERTAITYNGRKTSVLFNGNKEFVMNAFAPEINSFSYYMDLIKEYYENYALDRLLVKTHNILPADSEKKIFLIRSPVECIPSSFLLFGGRIDDNDFDDKLNFVIKNYLKFMKYHLKIFKKYKSNVLIMDHLKLVNDTKRELEILIKFLNISLAEEAISEVVDKFKFISTSNNRNTILEKSEKITKKIRTDCLNLHEEIVNLNRE